MTVKQDQAEMRRALLGVVPEELAFEWVFAQSNVSEDGNPANWPYDRERTLKALKPSKRSAKEMTNMFVPLFAARPDILLDIAREDSRVTVLKSMFSSFVASNCTLEQFLAFLEEVVSAFGHLPAALGDNIERFVYLYGEEAYRKLVRTSSSDPNGHFTDPTVGMVTSLAVKLVSEGRSVVEAFTISEIHNPEIVLAVMDRLHKQWLDFDVEDIIQYMKDKDMVFVYANVGSLIDSIPERYFRTIHSTIGLSNAIAEVLSEHTLLMRCQRHIADRYAAFLEKNPGVLVSTYDLKDHTLSSLEEYSKVPGMFYEFRTQFRKEPIGILDQSDMENLNNNTGRESWQHILDNFAATWPAVRQLATRGYLPERDLKFPHLAFNPVEVLDGFLSNILDGNFGALQPNGRGPSSMEILSELLAPDNVASASQETLEKARVAVRLHPQILNQLSHGFIGRMFHNMAKEDVLESINSFFVSAIVNDGQSHYVHGWGHQPRAFSFVCGEETVEVSKADMQDYLLNQIYQIAKSHLPCTEAPQPNSPHANVACAMDELTVRWVHTPQKFMIAFHQSLTRENFTEKVRELFTLGTSYGKPNYLAASHLADAFQTVNSEAGFSPYELPDFVDFLLEGVNLGEIALPLRLVHRKTEFILEGKLAVTGSSLLGFNDPKLIARLNEEFKDCPPIVWENYISTAPGWTGTFMELVETVKIVSV